MQETPAIILTDAPRMKKPDGKCPRCRAGAEKRVLSAGFGDPHDVCSQCGHEFEERTL